MHKGFLRPTNNFNERERIRVRPAQMFPDGSRKAAGRQISYFGRHLEAIVKRISRGTEEPLTVVTNES